MVGEKNQEKKNQKKKTSSHHMAHFFAQSFQNFPVLEGARSYCVKLALSPSSPFFSSSPY